MNGKYAEGHCSCFPYVRRMGFHHPRCDRRTESKTTAAHLRPVESRLPGAPARSSPHPEADR